METTEWRAEVEAPDDEGDALVAAATGWPTEIGAPPLLRWARPVMVGVHDAVSDPRWGIDVLSMRLTEAWVTSAAPTAVRGPLRVRTRLLQIVDLGTLTALRLGVEVSDGRSRPVAAASTTVAAEGSGLTDATRPLSPVLPSPPGGAAPGERPAVDWTGPGAADPDAVRAFATWSRDTTPIHHDAEAARAAGLAGPVAPGMFVLALLSAAAATATGAAVWGIGARFVRPTHVGDALTLGVSAPADAARLTVTAVGPQGPVVRRGWAHL